MIIIDDIHQGHENWDKARSVRPTASEFSKIFTGGGKPSTQREQYMRQLSVAMKYDMPKFQGNKWTDRGHELEPVARERFIQETGLDVREVGFITRDDGIAGGSPDGLIYDADGEPIAGIEIKCYNVEKNLGILEKGVLPTENKPQVHGHLWITGLKCWILVLYCPEAFPLDFRMIEVTPDGYTRELGAAVNDFCAELKEKRFQYLAEFELDQISLSIEQSCPVLYALTHEEKPQAKREEALI